MTSSTVRISTKIITWIYNNAGKIVLQRRYYSYQRIFLIHEYGVWLEIGCIRRFFFTAVSMVTIRSNVILVSRLVQAIILTILFYDHSLLRERTKFTGYPGWVIGIFRSQKKSSPPPFRNQKSYWEYC